MHWKTILVPHDFSSSANHAAALARDEAKLHGGTLVLLHVVDLPHAPADGQWDEDLLGGPADDIKSRLAVTAAGGDVQEGQLVSPLLVVTSSQLDRISGITQVLEVDTLDHAAGVNIKTGDDPYRDTHPTSLPSVTAR